MSPGMKRLFIVFTILVVCSTCLVLLFYHKADVGLRRVLFDNTGLYVMDKQRTEHLLDRPRAALTLHPAILKNRLQSRADRLMKECNRISVDLRATHKPPLDHIIVDDNHKLLYCFVPKVACTNLKRIMLILSGKVNVTDPTQIETHDVHFKHYKDFTRLKHFSPKDIMFRLNTYKKVIFVRDPLERLLSAYRNKFFEKGISNTYFKTHYAKYIIQTFRQNPSRTSLQYGHDLKFSEFIDYLLHPRTTIKGFDEHWNTYYNLCNPCHIQYNFIGHYETLEEDVDLLFKDISAGGITFPKRTEMYTTTKTRDTMAEFYRVIDTDKIRQLYELYSMDYSLFGYQLSETLQHLVNGTV